MTEKRHLVVFAWTPLTRMLLVLGCFSVLPTTLHGQGACPIFPGDKVVYGSSGQVTNAHDYIDASTLMVGAPTATDVCWGIVQALNELQNSTSCNTAALNSTGVIDARGILAAANGQLDCSVNPWSAPNPSTSAFVTVFFPAGTIVSPPATTGLTTTWFLPKNTHLVGAGPFATTFDFNLAAPNANMIQMGPQFNGGSGCPNSSGVVIEHLGLTNVGSYTTNGIYNNNAQELNYVNDVALTGITGTGLMIIGTNDSSLGCANNSGPYTNIYFSGTGTCVNINGTNGTRGIHGLNCVGTGSPSVAAILLDGRNNTIQDVSISGYTGDGILIGSQYNSTGNPLGAYAQNNFLLNIAGSSSLTNVVHIFANTVQSGAQPTDLTLMGISGGTGKTIINDAVSGPTLISRSPVGLYILGESMGPTGYSRFSTSSNAPVWLQGTAVPGATCPAGVVNGSLYSVTNNTNNPTATLWGCIGGSWVALK
jgi:hypothetical protein